jgi:anti-sigma factor RsiW
MQDMNQRPICHRAEDLVTYLYGEASAADAGDFQHHLQHCAACRSEFAVFNQVHESIMLWRNDALGASFNPAVAATEAAIDSAHFVKHERKLSAFAALREFFTVSPLWLRGATAFAALLLCALVLFAVLRIWPRPTPAPIAKAGGEKLFTKSELEAEVARQVKMQTEKMEQQQKTAEQVSTASAPRQSQRTELAAVRTPTKPRVKGLTREERVQLAADLRLIPGTEEEESLFELPEQPNQ